MVIASLDDYFNDRVMVSKPWCIFPIGEANYFISVFFYFELSIEGGIKPELDYPKWTTQSTNFIPFNIINQVTYDQVHFV